MTPKLMKIGTAREIKKWEEESGERCLEGKLQLEAPSAISELRIHNTLSQPSGTYIKAVNSYNFGVPMGDGELSAFYSAILASPWVLCLLNIGI